MCTTQGHTCSNNSTLQHNLTTAETPLLVSLRQWGDASPTPCKIFCSLSSLFSFCYLFLFKILVSKTQRWAIQQNVRSPNLIKQLIMYVCVKRAITNVYVHFMPCKFPTCMHRLAYHDLKIRKKICLPTFTLQLQGFSTNMFFRAVVILYLLITKFYCSLKRCSLTTEEH